MGSLASALSDLSNPKPGPKCTFGMLLAELDDIDRKALLNALSSGVQGEQIADVIRADGHPMLGATVQRHRKGRCTCEPSVEA